MTAPVEAEKEAAPSGGLDAASPQGAWLSLGDKLSRGKPTRTGQQNQVLVALQTIDLNLTVSEA
jgi:hypothetical protein